MTNNNNNRRRNNNNKQQQYVSKFDVFRDRALKSSAFNTVQNTQLATRDAFILGEKYGFNPPIRVDAPVLSDRMRLTQALSENDPVKAMVVVFGQQLNTIVAKLDDVERETGEASDLILIGILDAYLTHFYGVDAFENGATTAFFPEQ